MRAEEAQKSKRAASALRELSAMPVKATPLFNGNRLRKRMESPSRTESVAVLGAVGMRFAPKLASRG